MQVFAEDPWRQWSNRKRRFSGFQTLRIQGRIQDLRKGGGPWRARGARAYNGVWGRSPQRGQGAEPLVEGQGEQSPLKLKAFLTIFTRKRDQMLSI